MSNSPTKADVFQIAVLIVAWTWIAVPLGWGVYQSVQKSMPLFQGVAELTAPGR